MSLRKNSQTEQTIDPLKQQQLLSQNLPQTPIQCNNEGERLENQNYNYYSFIGIPQQQIIQFLDERRKQQFERSIKAHDYPLQSPQLSGHQVGMNGKNAASKSKLSKRRLVKKKVSKKDKYPLSLEYPLGLYSPLKLETPKAEFDSKEDPKDRKSENDNANEDSDELVFALL